jgi:catechol 2,3-dioxygenase-like lactoylglutathione lyase family enzyme
MRPFSRITIRENLRVFDHVTIRVSDRDASMRFYRLALGDPEHDGDFAEWGEFSLLEDTTVTRNLHVAFGVPRRDAVDAWWRKLVDAGYQGDGEPGPRPQYSDSYYGGFVRDPDGNSIEAVHHETTRGEGIDHLWLRSRDVAAAKAFYETAAPIAGIRLAHARDDFAHFRFSDGTGSFSFVADGAPATENVHLAFGANDTAAVERFHRILMSAGYRDNGEPGERPQYHPGYHGAFVLDPDGHNVEAVFHDRPL